jgi:6-pyruvoyltetrahydropterin/6-carboxytetrahydropterin synthase
MYRISKQFHFSAAHQLTLLPDEHPCKRMHGHNYIVEVVLERDELDERGFVVEYHELAPIKTYIDDNLYHRNLNDVLPYPPTSENIARFLYETFKPMFPMLAKVRVSETPKTWAEYDPGS